METLDIENFKYALDRNYVLVLTTNSKEKKYVSEVLQPSAKASILPDNDGARIGICGEQIILHITGTSGAQSDKSVGRIARQIISKANIPKPKAVILAGICWGAPEFTKVGSVLLCGEILVTNHIIIEADKNIYKPIKRISPWLNNLQVICDDINSGLKNEIELGILASGDHLIKNSAARDALLSAWPEVIGGEMEGWDLVRDLEELPWVQIRGVCDYAADGTHRLNQEVAAIKAASLLKPLLEALQLRECLVPTRRDQATFSLIEALWGNAIDITKPEDCMSLDEHLNYRIGPSLLWRISQYAIGAPSAPSLPRLITNLLLEVSQNALKHGGASQATIQFGRKSISYTDDGKIFDIFSLNQNPGRGGSDAFSTVMRSLVGKGIIEIEKVKSKRNAYKIIFPKLSDKLKKSKDECSVKINFGHIDPFSENTKRLNYKIGCDVLFIDADELLMSSRRIDISVEIKNLLIEGKEIFIKCTDEQERSYYEDELSGVCESRLHFIFS